MKEPQEMWSLSVIFVVCIVACTCIDLSNSQIAQKHWPKHKRIISEGFTKTALHGNGTFSKVLCIVFYNFPAPIRQVELHYKMWSPFFPNIVLYGAWDIDTISKLHELHLPAFEIDCETDNGFLAQRVILQGIDEFANNQIFTGYMYFHDDMLVSPKKLGALNQSIPWMADANTKITLDPWESRTFAWPWFNTKYGIDEMQKVMIENHEVALAVEKCFGSNHTWVYGQSDFLYIPASTVSRVYQYFQIFRNLYVEIGIATFLTCMIDLPLQLIPLCTNWNANERPFPHYARQCLDYELIHPIKLNSADSISVVEDYIKQHRPE